MVEKWEEKLGWCRNRKVNRSNCFLKEGGVKSIKYVEDGVVGFRDMFVLFLVMSLVLVLRGRVQRVGWSSLRSKIGNEEKLRQCARIISLRCSVMNMEESYRLVGIGGSSCFGFNAVQEELGVGDSKVVGEGGVRYRRRKDKRFRCYRKFLGFWFLYKVGGIYFLLNSYFY